VSRLFQDKVPILVAKMPPGVGGLEVYLVLGYHQVGETVLGVNEDDPEVRRIISEFSEKIRLHIKLIESQDLITS
jgi:hypothetical protein